MINSTTIWFIVGVILLLSEFLIPGFTIFFFGIGALLTSLLMFLIPSLHNVFWLQITIFLFSSITLFITLRKYFRNTLKGDLYKERVDYLGEECKVLEVVSEDKPGRILFRGTSWSALSTHGKIYKNQKVVIIGKKPSDPMVFIVKREEKT